MNQQQLCTTTLAAALALALTACGGGGGGGGGTVRPDPPPSVPPPATPPPTTPPPTTPPPVTPPVTPPVSPPMTRVTPTQPTFDAHLRAINALGLANTGSGVRIGVVDTGVNRNHPALAGRVVSSRIYVDPAVNNTGIDDVVGHGTGVASVAAGNPVGAWPGGVAPAAQIVSARIIADRRPSDDGSGSGNQVSGALGLAGIHADLVSDGVKIMNNSWGGLYWTNPAATTPIANEYRPFIQQNNGLVVFATGNDGREEPSSMAALPSQAGLAGARPAADLESGWLAVTAVDTSQTDALASYANACGVAARYCLAAPGTVVYPNPNADGSYVWAYGTSFAAPLVSGAAALVWQKYPYFSNDQVRQTLLGTARDIGAPGVDAVFGYGLLDVARAVNGPARFDWGDMVANIDQTGLGSVWGNAISGEGGLVKRGVGALGLSGVNTYSGSTRIERGTLALREGGSVRSNVSIAGSSNPAHAALQFIGAAPRVIGNVSNAGSVVLLSADTTATIEGDYQQLAGGQLMLALGVNALQVTGTATLAGGVHINGALPGYVAADGSRQPLLRAGGGLAGSFDSAATASNGVTLLQSAYGYSSNEAWLELQRVSVTTAATGASAAVLASAQRLEQAFEVLDGDAGLQATGVGLAAAALQQTPGGFEGLSATLQSLSGSAHLQAAAQTLQGVDMSRRGIATRFGQLHSTPRLRGTWQQSLGEAGQGSFAGSGMRVDGWLAGQDTALGAHGVLGLAVGEVRSSTGSQLGADHGQDRQAQAQLYAGWQHGRGYALAQAGAGQFQRRMDRQLQLGETAVAASSRYAGYFSSASLETGARFGSARQSVTPYAGLAWTRLHSDGFDEQGGAGFALRLRSASLQRTTALAGVRGERQWSHWSLRGYAEWQQAVSAQNPTLQASFTAFDSWSPLSAAVLPRRSMLAGVAAETWLGRHSQLSFGYDQRWGGQPGQPAWQVMLRHVTLF